MSCYALDTSIFSYLLRGNKEFQARIYQEVHDDDEVIILPIVYYKIKRGLIDSNSAIKLAAFEELCDMLGVDNVDIKMLNIATNIYANSKRHGRKIDDTDILIIASCLAHGYTLVTNNKQRFAGIEGLEVINWMG